MSDSVPSKVPVPECVQEKDLVALGGMNPEGEMTDMIRCCTIWIFVPVKLTGTHERENGAVGPRIQCK